MIDSTTGAAVPARGRPALRRLRGVVAGTALAALIAVPALPAAADSAPPDPTNPGTPTTVTVDALPTVQMNGVAWAQLIVGNTVYVAGQFTQARPAGAAAGTSQTARNNILAYNLTTGALITGFNPNLNGTAYALAASPDGSKIYVGGDFTKVGTVTRSRLAALSPSTGSALSAFGASVNGTVRAIQATASTVYIGGSFTAVTYNSVSTQRAKLAALSATNGAVNQAWNPLVTTQPNSANPTFSGRVNALQLSPTADRIVVGGNFTHLNGSTQPGYGLGLVSTSGTGRSVGTMAVNTIVRNALQDSSITSLASDGTYFYGTGYIFGTTGNLEGAFSGRWDTTALNWVEDCHGDSYGVYSAPGAGTPVYVVGHPHYCGNLGTGGFGNMPNGSAQRAIAFSKPATGRAKADTNGYPSFTNQPTPTLQNWFPQLTTGTFTGQNQAAWTVTGSGKYVVAGGEFRQVNGSGQQGLVRFATSDIAPNLRGPRLRGSTFPVTATSPAAGQVRLSWTANYDYDNTRLTYRIYRDGAATPVGTVTGDSTWWSQPGMSFTDTGVSSGTHSYVVRATDTFGKDTASSDAVSVSVTGGGTVTPPPSGTAFGADTFTRTTSSGLGSADTGGSWTTYGSASGFSTGNGVASLTHSTGGTGLAAALNAATARESDVTVGASLSKVPTGSNAYVGVIARRVGSNEYRAKVKVDTAGQVTVTAVRQVGSEAVLQTAVISGTRLTAGQRLNIRVQAVGSTSTTLRARVWVAGSAEPTSWQVSVVDSTASLQTAGSAGVFSYVAGSVTNLPVAARFDDFRAVTG